MQQGNLNLSWNTNNQFYGYVADNNIYTYTGEQIGVNLAKHREVEEGLIKCKNRLIELGEIKIPKTPEEIIKEQNEMLEKQGNVLNDMMNKYAELQKQIEVINNEHGTIKGIGELSTAGNKEQCNQSNNESIGDGRPDTDKNKRGCSSGVPKSKK